MGDGKFLNINKLFRVAFDEFRGRFSFAKILNGVSKQITHFFSFTLPEMNDNAKISKFHFSAKLLKFICVSTISANLNNLAKFKVSSLSFIEKHLKHNSYYI